MILSRRLKINKLSFRMRTSICLMGEIYLEQTAICWAIWTLKPSDSNFHTWSLTVKYWRPKARVLRVSQAKVLTREHQLAIPTKVIKSFLLSMKVRTNNWRAKYPPCFMKITKLNNPKICKIHQVLRDWPRFRNFMKLPSLQMMWKTSSRSILKKTSILMTTTTC